MMGRTETTRRAMLGALTVLPLAVGARASASPALTNALSADLAMLLAHADSAEAAYCEHVDAVLDPAQARFAIAEAAIPHRDVLPGPPGYDGGPMPWSTANEWRVRGAKAAVRVRVAFHGPGDDARAYYLAQRRLAAAAIWRDRAVQRARAGSGLAAAEAEALRLDGENAAASAAICDYTPLTLGDLDGKFEHMWRRDLTGAAWPAAFIIRADIRRILGEAVA